MLPCVPQIVFAFECAFVCLPLLPPFSLQFLAPKLYVSVYCTSCRAILFLFWWCVCLPCPLLSGCDTSISEALLKFVYLDHIVKVRGVLSYFSSGQSVGVVICFLPFYGLFRALTSTVYVYSALWFNRRYVRSFICTVVSAK